MTVFIILGVLCFSFAGCGAGQEKPAKYRIAVIPKGTTHDFWQSIHAGAIHAANEHGSLKILWDGPPKEDLREEQQRIVERFTSEQVDAIVLAPCDRLSLVGAAEGAIKKAIPVVIIDSGLELSPLIRDSDKYLGYIATDNREGGVQAAKRMIQLLKGKERPKVMMLRFQAGSESTEQREAGFTDTIRTLPGVEFIVPSDEAGATADSAQKVAERLLTDHKELDGFFATNESCTIGVLQALRVLQRTRKLKFVGFDASMILIDALRAGELDGLVMQDPFDMSYQAVLRAVDYLDGKPLPKDRTRHTNLQVATKENLNDPKIKPLYARDLTPYLGR